MQVALLWAMLVLMRRMRSSPPSAPASAPQAEGDSGRTWIAGDAELARM
jgi:hypothetical protein